MYPFQRTADLLWFPGCCPVGRWSLVVSCCLLPGLHAGHAVSCPLPCRLGFLLCTRYVGRLDLNSKCCAATDNCTVWADKRQETTKRKTTTGYCTTVATNASFKVGRVCPYKESAVLRVLGQMAGVSGYLLHRSIRLMVAPFSSANCSPFSHLPYRTAPRLLQASRQK